MSCWKLSYDEQTFKQLEAGTIYNIETQLLAYTDDIDIVGKSQSAVQDALEREAAIIRVKNK
jgi:hypothetical protein